MSCTLEPAIWSRDTVLRCRRFFFSKLHFGKHEEYSQEKDFCFLGNDTFPNLDDALVYEGKFLSEYLERQIYERLLKDVRAHCYCASLVRTLFIGHARATSFSSARTESKTQQNIELVTFALTWCANIFVECSVTPTFFSADHFLF